MLDVKLLKRYAVARSALVASSAFFLAIIGERSVAWCSVATAVAVAAAVPPRIRMSLPNRALGVMVGDIALPMVIANATGGEASPFLILYYMAAIIAGIVFSLRSALLTAGASTAALFWTVMPSNAGLNGIAPALWVRLSVAVAFLFLVGLLSGYLGRALRGRLTRQDPLQQRLAHIGQSSAVIVHELRNLLKPLSGAVELLEGDLKTDPRSEPVLRLIREECEAMEAYLGEFLDYTRDGAFEAQELAVPDLLGAVTTSVSRHPDARAATIRASSEPGLTIVGDPPSLKRALTNVVLNCAQAAPTGVVIVGSRRDGMEEVLIEVEDNGPGMDAAVRERVFEPFFSTRRGGTGLGLAVARRTVERHGGTILAENAKTGGARFVIRLPRRGPQVELVGKLA